MLGLRILYSEVEALDGAILPLVGTSLRLGRGTMLAAGRSLDDPRLSREHLSVARTGNPGAATVTVTDLESRNGTFVAGERIAAPTPLTPGDVLQAGGTFFELVSDVGRAIATEPDDAASRLLRGWSPSLTEARRMLRSLAPADVDVLLLGPPGSGKECAARALHELRERSGELVSLNCATLTEGLAESALFGHLKGSFTGADSDRQGAMRQAHAGTLFLDEVGDLPATVQAKLLRALQERCVRPVGGDREIDLSVHVVSATNHDLAARVRDGDFRADLYSRLSQAVVRLPPLHERLADVVPLAHHFLPEGQRVHPETVEALLLHPWPNSVRDLAAVVRLLEAGPDGRMRLSAAAREKLAADRQLVASHADAAAPAKAEAPASTQWPTDAGERRELLDRLLTEHGGNVARVARALDKRVTSVRRWIKDHELDPDRYRPTEQQGDS